MQRVELLHHKHSYIVNYSQTLMPRLHQDPGRATCIRIHICRWIHDTSRSSGILVNCISATLVITILFIMSRSTCIPLYPATDGRQTGDNFVADTRNMLTATSGYKWVQLVSGNMYPGVNAA